MVFVPLSVSSFSSLVSVFFFPPSSHSPSTLHCRPYLFHCLVFLIVFSFPFFLSFSPCSFPSSSPCLSFSFHAPSGLNLSNIAAPRWIGSAPEKFDAQSNPTRASPGFATLMWSNMYWTGGLRKDGRANNLVNTSMASYIVKFDDLGSRARAGSPEKA